MFTARYGLNVFCMDLRTNSYYFPIQHWMTGFYNRDEVCLLRGTVWMCFVWISEQTAIISLYSTEWLVFITETDCVYCAVRSVDLIIFRLIFVYKGPCHCSDVQSPVSYCGGPGSFRDQSIWELWLWGRFFFNENFGIPLSVSFHEWSIPFFIYMLVLPVRKQDEA